ncbi:hypothetical protein L6452_17550 [Arctium lappa]|uniref:Uncharacterized protein n=1 Tax=Arctium lappa TaxID=4217 RepID=A0ACB9C3V1_ARCLA|nr:hypothetical protein L6452_17550 [Arctium lappa]
MEKTMETTDEKENGSESNVNAKGFVTTNLRWKRDGRKRSESVEVKRGRYPSLHATSIHSLPFFLFNKSPPETHTHTHTQSPVPSVTLAGSLRPPQHSTTASSSVHLAVNFDQQSNCLCEFQDIGT